MLMRVALLSLVACAGMASGQIAAPEEKRTEPLSGPRVETPAAEPTLIKQSMTTGLIVRLETSPEEAALELVGLTPEERVAVDKVLAERAAVLDKIVADNVAKLLKYQGLRSEETPRERMQALTEIFRAMAPMTEYNKTHGGPLQQISALIAPEKMAKVQKMVSDYRNALMAEAEASEPHNPKHDTPEKRQSALRGREALLALGTELKRSYDRQIAAKIAALNELITKVGATPEQEGKIRALASEFAQKTLGGKATLEQKRELFAAIFKELDDNQKLVLLSEVYGVKATPADPTPAGETAAPRTPTSAPEPLSDEAIAKFDVNTARREWASRAAYVQKNPTLDQATKDRLKSEAEKCKVRMNQAKDEGK